MYRKIIYVGMGAAAVDSNRFFVFWDIDCAEKMFLPR